MMGPRSMETGCTRQLISRYEAIQNQALSSPSQSRPPSTPPSLSLKRPLSPSKKKEKSPIRQSFHNLLTLLKKKNTKSLPEYPQHHATPLQEPLHSEPAARPSSTAHSGSLLYLSQPLSSPCYSPILPVWTTCTATLGDQNILLSWLTTGGSPDTLSIALEDCTDVRSLSSSQLNENELALLPNQGNDEELKLFELVFEGRARERFAASSVRERASWVSAIWDVVLQMQETKSAFCLDWTLKSLMPDTNQRETDILSIPDTGKPLPKVQERNLPALPDEPPSGDDPVFVQNKSTLESPGIHSRSLSACSPSLQSPSIANLSQRSMVKQRLAQMERHQSETTSLASPVSQYGNQPSTARARTTVLFPCEEMLRQEDTGADSIVESYALTNPYFPIQSSTPSAELWPPAGSVDHGVNAAQGETTTKFSECHPRGDQFSALQLEIQDLPHKFAAIRAHQDVPLLNNIHHSISNVDQQVNSTSQALQSINNKLDDIREQLNSTASRTNSISNDDVSGILRSLDGLRDLLTSDIILAIKKLEDVCCRSSPAESGPVSKDVSSAQLTEVLTLLKGDREERTSQAQQQAECVRYLNELNIWLEAFVNNGTSQIQTLSTSFQQLCSTLGCTPSSESIEGTGLVSDIQRLVQDVQNREQSSAQLQAVLCNIAARLDAGSAFTPQTIAELMNRQRQDHEGLLRMVTAELSKEIKGERLRFVEAMKEATAINVQSHVEEFKKELKREVQGMTQEVGQLYRERQAVENQIADLFAFYAKQKNDAVSSMPTSAFDQASNIHPEPRGLRTPLPSPQRNYQRNYH